MAVNSSKRKKARVPRTTLVLGGLALALVALVVVFFVGNGGERVRDMLDLEPAKPAEEPGAAAAGARTVTLYFLDDEDDFLHEEKREIAAGPTEAEEAERALAELVKGSEKGLVSPLPPQTKVRQVFIARDGLATVDFSRDVAEKFAYGSSSELAAVYAVVDTLARNLPSVKKVVILIEGAERETLGGHVDLSRAFRPDYSLVKK